MLRLYELMVHRNRFTEGSHTETDEVSYQNPDTAEGE